MQRNDAVAYKYFLFLFEFYLVRHAHQQQLTAQID